jgi:putative tryptophan/tyrosine transport system substrate-binding protein
LKKIGWSVFFVAAALLTVEVIAEAQQTGKIFRIGYLDSGTASGGEVLIDAFRQELSRLGWIEGKTITIEYRFAGPAHVSELLADLVRLKVDLIVVSTTPTALAAKNATTTIPIVVTNVGDPVAAGLIASLAQPGGNVTGLSGLGPQLNTKRLEILKDAVPKLVRVVLLRPAGGGAGTDLQLKELRPAAVVLKLNLEEIETQINAKGLENAFQAAKQQQVKAIMTTITPRFFSARKRIVELAVK